MEYVFRNHLTYALEQANDFYMEKREQVMTSFKACAHAVDAIAQVSLLLLSPMKASSVLQVAAPSMRYVFVRSGNDLLIAPATCRFPGAISNPRSGLLRSDLL